MMILNTLYNIKQLFSHCQLVQYSPGTVWTFQHQSSYDSRLFWDSRRILCQRRLPQGCLRSTQAQSMPNHISERTTKAVLVTLVMSLCLPQFVCNISNTLVDWSLSKIHKFKSLVFQTREIHQHDGLMDERV